MAKTFETIISVLDKASAPVLGLEEKLASLGKVGAHTQKQLKISPHERLWNELTEHVRSSHEAFSEFGDKLGEVGSSLAEVLPMLGAIGTVGSVGGLLEMVHATAEAAEALQNVAIISGVTVSQMQALEYAGGQVGIATDQMSNGFGRLNERMAKAASGQDKRSAGLFHAMGISLRDASGHMKTAVEILPQLMNSFEKTTSPAIRNAMAMQLFGISGFQMLPFLTMGSQKLDTFQKKFTQVGYAFSPEALEKLEKFNESWKDMNASVTGLGSAISVELAPVITPIIEDFALWIATNRDWIAQDISGVIKRIGDDLKQISLKQVIDETEHLVHVGEEVIDMVGGMQTVMIAGGVIIAAAFLEPVISLTLQMGRLALAMGAPIAGAVLDLGATLVGVIPHIKSFRDVWAALDLVMDANPLGVAILGAAALGAAAFELYEHWQTAEKIMTAIFNDIGDAFNDVFGPVEQTMNRIGAGIHNLAADIGIASSQVTPGQYAAEPASPDNSFNARFGDSPSSPLNPRPLYGPGSPTAPAQSPGQSGQVDVNVHIQNNTPNPVVAGAKSTGAARQATVNVGRNSLLDQGPHPQ
jgi:hypothetical protein